MTIRIQTTQVWVHDQNVALEFYTKKLGFEVSSDVTMPEMGNFRWLTVSPPGQPDISIVLMAIPGEPVMDAETKAEVERIVAKGFASAVFFTTDDCWKTYNELKDRGVEFVSEPEDQPYGIDVGFRDPSGNHFRLSQLKPNWG